MILLKICFNWLKQCYFVGEYVISDQPPVQISPNFCSEDGAKEFLDNFLNGHKNQHLYSVLTAPTNEFVGFYPSASTEALVEYRDSPSRSMFCAAFSSLS